VAWQATLYVARATKQGGDRHGTQRALLVFNSVQAQLPGTERMELRWAIHARAANTCHIVCCSSTSSCAQSGLQVSAPLCSYQGQANGQDNVQLGVAVVAGATGARYCACNLCELARVACRALVEHQANWAPQSPYHRDYHQVPALMGHKWCIGQAIEVYANASMPSQSNNDQLQSYTELVLPGNTLHQLVSTYLASIDNVALLP
jgi:hypothetical protein